MIVEAEVTVQVVRHCHGVHACGETRCAAIAGPRVHLMVQGPGSVGQDARTIFNSSPTHPSPISRALCILGHSRRPLAPDLSYAEWISLLVNVFTRSTKVYCAGQGTSGRCHCSQDVYLPGSA